MSERVAKRRHDPSDIPPLEWAAAGLGLALLIGFLTLILHNAIAGPKGAPDIELKVKGIQAVRTGHLVLFEVHNHGGTTASTLAVRGELVKDDATVERSDAEIDHLPPGSHRSGGMFFRNDPSKAKLELAAVSFQDP